MTRKGILKLEGFGPQRAKAPNFGIDSVSILAFVTFLSILVRAINAKRVGDGGISAVDAVTLYALVKNTVLAAVF